MLVNLSAIPTAYAGQLEDLSQYKSIELEKGDSTALLSSLKDNGLAAGAQLGFFERTQEIVAVVKSHDAALDTMYPFGALLSKEGYLPPVIEEIGRTSEVVSGNRINESEMRMRIVKPAQFHLTVPTFRDYLFSGFPQSFIGVDEFTPPSLKPKTEKAKKVWADSIKEGYAAGRSQADKLFELNLSHVNADFIGMWRYNRLLALGMVKPPAVAKSVAESTVTDNEIIVVPRSSEIVDNSKFNQKIDTWKREMSRE